MTRPDPRPKSQTKTDTNSERAEISQKTADHQKQLQKRTPQLHVSVTKDKNSLCSTRNNTHKPQCRIYK